MFETSGSKMVDLNNRPPYLSTNPSDPGLSLDRISKKLLQMRYMQTSRMNSSCKVKQLVLFWSNICCGALQKNEADMLKENGPKIGVADPSELQGPATNLLLSMNSTYTSTESASRDKL
jgi:hypothetical protein